MHHRTSTDAIRQSICDMYFCISWPEKSQHASSHIDRFDSPVPMWETTFPRNSHAGLGRPFYERNVLTRMKMDSSPQSSTPTRTKSLAPSPSHPVPRTDSPAGVCPRRRSSSFGGMCRQASATRPPLVGQSPFRTHGRDSRVSKFMLPKRRCWKPKQQVGRVFSRDFARV